MKVTQIGHASMLVEAGPLKILSDPWWRGPCFGSQWWIYPDPRTDLVDYRGTDFLYISHGHHDHLHPPTLRLFARSAKVLVSAHLDIAPAIEALGFEVVRVSSDAPVSLGHGVECWIWPTHGDDSLCVVRHGREVCVNVNDALHSAPAAVQDAITGRLKAGFGRIDYLFCGYGIASHFPNCYDVPGRDGPRTTAKRQHYFNGMWAKIVHALEPKLAFPFAADVALLDEELFFANEPTHNSERPTDLFLELHPNSATTVVDIAPGFSAQDGTVLNDVRRRPLSSARLRDERADAVQRANRKGRVDAAEIDDLADLVRANIRTVVDYLREYRGDYTFTIEFRDALSKIVISKRGGELDVESREDVSGLDPDVRYVTRAPYLKMSLTQQYGDEVLFVGSGGIFHLRSRATAEANVQRELRVILTRHDSPVRSRYGTSSAGVFRLKQFAKKLLGRREDDLYDLGSWIEFESTS